MGDNLIYSSRFMNVSTEVRVAIKQVMHDLEADVRRPGVSVLVAWERCFQWVPFASHGVDMFRS
jgi:hypothetical protein